MDNDKKMLLQKAVLYEKAEMFEDMITEMKEFIVTSEADLGDVERKMLSNGYKSVIGKKRSAWRTINAFQEKLEDDNPKKPLVIKYLAEITKDLTSKCKELLTLLEDYLIPRANGAESKVFFLKMKGDHLRYLVEILPDKEDLRHESKQAYLEAVDISEKSLGPAHPFRLGLALNFSVFQYEIENCQSVAHDMAKKAFDDAVPELENLEDDELEDATTMMQLLRDNLTFWSEDL